MGEGGHPAKEEALRRFSEPEGDHELHSVLERMKAHHPHLSEALHLVHFSHDAGPAQLEDRRRAPKRSQVEIWAEQYGEAMGLLRTGLQYATWNSGLRGVYGLGHGDARYVVAQLFVECLCPAVVAEHV
jgi:hypothetical protein